MKGLCQFLDIKSIKGDQKRVAKSTNPGAKKVEQTLKKLSSAQNLKDLFHMKELAAKQQKNNSDMMIVEGKKATPADSETRTTVVN